MTDDLITRLIVQYEDSILAKEAADRIAALEAENNHRTGIIHDQDAHILALEAQLAAAKAGLEDAHARMEGCITQSPNPDIGHEDFRIRAWQNAILCRDDITRILAAITLSTAPAYDPSAPIDLSQSAVDDKVAQT